MPAIQKDADGDRDFPKRDEFRLEFHVRRHIGERRQSDHPINPLGSIGPMEPGTDFNSAVWGFRHFASKGQRQNQRSLPAVQSPSGSRIRNHKMGKPASSIQNRSLETCAAPARAVKLFLAPVTMVTVDPNPGRHIRQHHH